MPFSKIRLLPIPNLDSSYLLIQYPSIFWESRILACKGLYNPPIFSLSHILEWKKSFTNNFPAKKKHKTQWKKSNIQAATQKTHKHRENQFQHPSILPFRFPTPGSIMPYITQNNQGPILFIAQLENNIQTKRPPFLHVFLNEKWGGGGAPPRPPPLCRHPTEKLDHRRNENPEVVFSNRKFTPLKSNIATQNSHVWKEIHLPKHHFWVFMLNFQGVHLLIMVGCFLPS